MRKLLFLFIIPIFFSCSKDEAPAAPEPVTLTTNPAQNISGLDAKITGTISSMNGVSGNIGVCWSESPNPTLADYSAASGSSTNEIVSIITVNKSNTLYYVRVFAQIGNEIKYGNTITFTSQAIITSVLATDILTTSALLRGYSIESANFDIAQRGFCYSTLPNPTITNNIRYTSGGEGYYEVTATELQPNTTYYVRPYIKEDFGAVHYEQEFTIKTTGYTGPGGGYVAYDKGEFTNGWRYLEINLTRLHYNYPTTWDAEWGCSSSFLGQTSTAIGTGLENTQRIISTCGSANSAAKLCSNAVLNGKSDWFLPSRDEMFTIRKSLLGVNVGFENSWTSSEISISSAYVIYYDTFNSEYTYRDSNKSYSWAVYAVRRY
ncbi:DUF1566 domain-containing protein [Flavobacterium sp. SM15]|uniref:DUF1566 domain-containing protein n=1 Tax=Flavobacterium sp. SM15 TaxID=2908005 RepID=UPI001EDC4D00|nr:DUF1566 domain-containing protein [Flavobacterium sp. SM15]MCG2611480.1 DUF1566 domain-containing protein [Flavobacterium sp. SM15]